MYLRHLWSVITHKYFVLLAGLRVGVPLPQLLLHDLSKFSPAEFPAYARRFHGNGEGDQTAVEESFAAAWLHHENHNPHHWGYWIPRSGKQVNQPLPMPERYVREMIADWMGASRTYTGSWDMSEWLARNLPRIQMHGETAVLIDGILQKLGYIPTGDEMWDYHYR
jgi:hypothetical protein